jgi:hypothetical protein
MIINSQTQFKKLKITSEICRFDAKYYEKYLNELNKETKLATLSSVKIVNHTNVPKDTESSPRSLKSSKNTYELVESWYNKIQNKFNEINLKQKYK